jgi:pimeloyl-ACP methyl ester carboxylesterase
METPVGEVTTKEAYLPFRDYRTWYRVTGSLESGKLPLVVAHGGPGCTHDYVDSFKDIAALDGRPVIHYDQLGNGNSTRLPEKGPDFWTVGLFLEELDALLSHLGIQQHYAFLGQSWGGMLGAEHAVPEVARTFAIMDEDNTVYRNMNGPTEFHVIGTMKDWTIENRLDRIEAPTLLISGKYDEATPLVVRPYLERVPGCEWVLFENSSHMPHVEEKQLCLATVSGFLSRHD